MSVCTACSHEIWHHTDRALPTACGIDQPPTSSHDGRRIPRTTACRCPGYTTHHQGDTA